MVFTKHSLKKFTKHAVKGIRKAMNVGESIVNAVDKHTGGALRHTAKMATGGLSEKALKVYNANKGHVHKALDLAEGKKGATVANLVEGTALNKPFHKGMEHVRKYEPVARELGQRNETFGRVIKSYDDNIKNKLGA